jgi:hypothetical protein
MVGHPVAKLAAKTLFFCSLFQGGAYRAREPIAPWATKPWIPMVRACLGGHSFVYNSLINVPHPLGQHFDSSLTRSFTLELRIIQQLPSLLFGQRAGALSHSG